uniref:Uncharacterized protein n=1 Tax=Avena sativa TaxID=4498 RepID=A0ACD5U3C9_AVESA
MDMEISDLWLAIAIFSITAVLTNIARGRITFDPESTKPLPPVVNCITLIGLLPTILTKGIQATIHNLYTKYGSVFTINFFGSKITFLIGPEVSTHFFQGPESKISQGNFYEFTVPMFGQEVGFGVDTATRSEQRRFHIDALKPSKLRSHVNHMLQEVEEYFAKWGQYGIIDLKYELDKVLMLISGRCLLGKEIREKMIDEFYTLFHEVENGLNLVSLLFPYIPIPTNRRRDSARIKLKEVLSKTVRSRRRFGQVEEDTLQKLIDSRYKDGRSTTEAEVTGLIIALVFVGKHTSSHTSVWTGACLLNNAKCMEAVIEEQKIIIAKFGDKIDYNVLLQMNILHGCIKEALRMHPTTPILVRKTHENFTIWTKEGNEYTIPAGHTLVSPTILNNNIPYIYKDPEVYDPERFGPEREEDKVGGKFSYTSFSGGMHACPGESYSYMQIKIILSHLLRNFELRLESPFPKVERGKFSLEPQGEVLVSYKRRKLPVPS